MNIVKQTLHFLPLILFFLLLILAPSAHAAPPSADLSVSLQASSSQVLGNFQYFITFTNNGPDTAYDVVIDDVLPNGMLGNVTHSTNLSPGGCDNGGNSKIHCVIPAVTPGSSGRIDINIYQIEGVSAVVINTAVISSKTFDNHQKNNQSTVSVEVKNNNTISNNTEESCKSARECRVASFVLKHERLPNFSFRR